MNEPRYPLAWPTGWPRTEPDARRHAQFSKQGHGLDERRLTMHDGINRVMAAIKAFTRAGHKWAIKPDDVIISTNMPTRLDGGIRADARKPDDPGAAVYWTDAKGARRCMAADHYTTVGDNLAAIAASLEALRTIERHGGARILDRAFTGFAALPAPGASKQWHEVFGVTANAATADVEIAYRRARSASHPDRPGGSHDNMAAVNAAWEQFKAERGIA